MAQSPQSEGIRVPLLGANVRKPDRGSAAWYAGLGLITALEIIEWPVAVLVAVSHLLATNASNPEVQQAAKGAETGS